MKHLSLFVIGWLIIYPVGTLLAQQPTGRAARIGLSPLLNESMGGASLSQQGSRLITSPRQATIRSLVVPGLGQLYNRQPWKLAVIYGGAGAAIYFYAMNQRLYNQYLAGYQEAYSLVTTGSKTAIVNGRVLRLQQLKQASDQNHQQRDLTVILTVGGWAINVVEANVAAHLKSFDLSDDLSMQVAPTLLASGGLGFVPGVRVTVRK